MTGLFVGKYIGCNKREYNGKSFYSFSILQDGLNATRVDCPEEVFYNLKELKELTKIQFVASVFANAKDGRAWIALKVYEPDSVRLMEDRQNGSGSVPS